MSSATLQYNASRVKPAAQSQAHSSKPLSYFVNLRENIETTELTQLQLREFIATLLTISSKRQEDGSLQWPFDLKHRVRQPKWVGEKWKIFMLDPVGVIRWASQFLVDENQEERYE